ncbi:MAG: response regulator transcription factor [Anaerolineae bacterium]|nr:response regulator transcription factor [Anaerolineae bacterium]
MVRIYLVEDHAIVLDGLRTLLSDEPDFEIVGESRTATGVVDQLHLARPDVLLTDLLLGRTDALEMIDEVHETFPHMRIIVLSMHQSLSDVAQAFAFGASGYLPKDVSYAELVSAIRRVLDGKRVLGVSLTEAAVEAEIRRLKSGPREAYLRLTRREREVMKYAAAGHKNPEIARLLCISPRTVETHRDNAMRKLGLRNQSDLIHYAVNNGILRPD